MNTNPKIDDIRKEIKTLYNEKKTIHVDVLNKRTRVKNALCEISGIYEYFHCVSSNINGYMESFSISYVDILTKQIIIRELQ